MLANREQAFLTFKHLMNGSLGHFTQMAFRTIEPDKEYKHNWHIDAITHYLQACEQRQIKRLVINMPPRLMKSICVSIAFPAWLLGRNPSNKIMVGSYSSGLSRDHSQKTRLVMSSDWYGSVFPKTEFRDDLNRVDEIGTTAMGHRIATSVKGTATGKGADFLIVDDPHNPVEAASDTERNRGVEWFRTTFSSRLDDRSIESPTGGVIIVVMQRLHEDDLTGHLLEDGGWEHLMLPMVEEVGTTITFGKTKIERPVGDILHKERFFASDIEQIKRDMGSYGFAGQYQQIPSPSDGGVFKKSWFNYYDHENPPQFKQIVQSWDTAYQAKKISDPSCCTTWGIDEDGKYYLIECFTDRLEYPDLLKVAGDMADRYKPHFILVENKASGQSLIQDMLRSGLPIVKIEPTSDKITRASTASPLIESGSVHLPKEAKWLNDYISEIILFPNSKHDDRVDSTSQFLNWHYRNKKQPRIRTL